MFYIIIHYNILQTLLCRVQGGGLSIITIDITMVIGCMNLVYSNTYINITRRTWIERNNNTTKKGGRRWGEPWKGPLSCAHILHQCLLIPGTPVGITSRIEDESRAYDPVARCDPFVCCCNRRDCVARCAVYAPHRHL